MITLRVTEHTAAEALIQIREQRHFLEGCSAWGVLKNGASNIKWKSGWNPIYVGGMHVRARADIDPGCSHHKSLSLAATWGWRWSWREDLWEKEAGWLLLKGPWLGGTYCHGKTKNPAWDSTPRRLSFSETCPPALLPHRWHWSNLQNWYINTKLTDWFIMENKVDVGLYTNITMKKSCLPVGRLIKAPNQVWKFEWG